MAKSDYLRILEHEYKRGSLSEQDYKYAKWEFSGKSLKENSLQIFSGVYDGIKRPQLKHWKNLYNEYGKNLNTFKAVAA